MNTPAPASSAWCLRFLSGAVRGRTIALKPGANVVGSAGDCDVMLPGSDVLPQHLMFTVGELVVSVQKIGAAAAMLNGEEMKQRRSVVAGDIVSLGQIDVQLDRHYVSIAHDDGALADWSESVLPSGDDEPPEIAVAAPQRRRHWVGGSVIVLALVGIIGLAWWDGASAGRQAADALDIAAIEKTLAGFPEVEAVAAPGGTLVLRGYVESRGRRIALRDAMLPHGARVTVSVLSADEMLEHARRFVSDPGVSVAYSGHGRLTVSGTVEDEAVRLQLRRLSEDLHPAVLVTDRVRYQRPKNAPKGDAKQRDQWAAWQKVLPARLVGITEDASGLRHIQLANGSRYYEGAVLKSGAELKRIEADGLVLAGEPAKDAR